MNAGVVPLSTLRSPRKPSGNCGNGGVSPGANGLTKFGVIRTSNSVRSREFVWLECTSCSSRNYRTPKETRGADRLELKKYCPKERKHTPHKESRKK